LGELANADAAGDRATVFRATLKLLGVAISATPPGFGAGPYFDAMIDDLLEGNGGQPCPNGCHEIGPASVPASKPNLQFWQSVDLDAEARARIIIEPINQ
jgi:hypothetical protein